MTVKEYRKLPGGQIFLEVVKKVFVLRRDNKQDLQKKEDTNEESI